MMPSQDPDPELEALRARRLEEIRSRATSAPRHDPTDSAPFPLKGAAVTQFLSTHPRVVVDVWAPWCGPCRAIAPLIETLAQELAPRVRFAKLNSDEEPAWAQRWNVEGIPTLLMFEHGQLIDRVVGVVPYATLKARIGSAFRTSVSSPEDSDRS